MSLPTAEPLGLPSEYGKPTQLLEWSMVDDVLQRAPHYWLATVRPDGRPHTVPVDGLWLDAALCFGGSADALHHRNLQAHPAATVHLEEGPTVVIVEGDAEWVEPDVAAANRLAAASKAKYGYAPPVDAYLSGLWTLAASKVMAWTEYPTNATRYLFP